MVLQSPKMITLYLLMVFGSSLCILLVCVDKIILTSSDSSCIDKVQLTLSSLFKLNSLDTFQYFLGLEIVKPNKGVSLSKKKIYLIFIW